MRDARAESSAGVDGRFDVGVLEPSPTAVDEPPFFADDPLAGGDGPWERRSGEFWNERFGASLSYEELVAGADPLAFFRHATELLAR